jgi:hypothetical protein
MFLHKKVGYWHKEQGARYMVQGTRNMVRKGHGARNKGQGIRKMRVASHRRASQEEERRMGERNKHFLVPCTVFPVPFKAIFAGKKKICGHLH